MAEGSGRAPQAGDSLSVLPVESARTIIAISDTHSGCRLALAGREPFRLDDGGPYQPSPLQLKLWDMWREFWDEWVPMVTHGEPYIVVHNGDPLEGVHHGAVTQISHNKLDQKRLAKSILAPEVAKAAAFYMVRGTEAHGGPSDCDEESLAEELGAIPNEQGQHARWELWMNLGGHLVHFSHHIGTTGSSAYEATAVHKELNESFVEAGRWGDTPPQVIVRSHRHRFIETRIAGKDGYYSSVVTPGWQLKTPFAHKIPGARVSQPQIGGIAIRLGDEELHTRSKVWRIERPKEVIIG